MPKLLMASVAKFDPLFCVLGLKCLLLALGKDPRSIYGTTFCSLMYIGPCIIVRVAGPSGRAV